MSWLLCSLAAYAISTPASDGVVALANPLLQLGNSHARPNMENLARMIRCAAVCRIVAIVSLIVYGIMGHLGFLDGIDAGNRKLYSLDAPPPLNSSLASPFQPLYLSFLGRWQKGRAGSKRLENKYVFLPRPTQSLSRQAEIYSVCYSFNLTQT